MLENHVMHEMLIKILGPLCSTVTVERRLHKNLVHEECSGHNITTDYLGMGEEEETWYGSIDGLLRSKSGYVPIVNKDEDERN